MSDNPSKLFEKFGRRLGKGEIIFREGDFGDTMYIIQEGEIEIRKRAGQAFKVLSSLRAGDFFGEMALIDKSPRSATAVAIADSALLEVTHRSFEYMLEHNLDFTKRLVRELVEKIRSSNELIYELLTKNKKHRLVNALVRFSRFNWSPTPKGNAIELNPFLEWASGTIGIERQQIITILNNLVKEKGLFLEKRDNRQYLIVPSGPAGEA